MESTPLRPFPCAARLRHALHGTAHAPIPLGRGVPGWVSRVPLRSVVDNRHHFLALQTATPTALLRHFVAGLAKELATHLHLPPVDAIQPAAGGLRDMASAQRLGNLHVPLRGLQQLKSSYFSHCR